MAQLVSLCDNKCSLCCSEIARFQLHFVNLNVTTVGVREG